MSIPQFLQTAKYVDLVTFKRDGTRVSTPVWFAIDSTDRLVVYSDKDAGKMKRIRNNHKIELAPCTFRGKRVGPQVTGNAAELSETQGKEVHRLLNAKYGIRKTIFQFFVTASEKIKRSGKRPEAFLAITLDNVERA
jgi:uncharacterized protein